MADSTGAKSNVSSSVAMERAYENGGTTVVSSTSGQMQGLLSEFKGLYEGRLKRLDEVEAAGEETTKVRTRLVLSVCDVPLSPVCKQSAITVELLQYLNSLKALSLGIYGYQFMNEPHIHYYWWDINFVTTSFTILCHLGLPLWLRGLLHVK